MRPSVADSAVGGAVGVAVSGVLAGTADVGVAAGGTDVETAVDSRVSTMLQKHRSHKFTVVLLGLYWDNGK